MKGKHARRAALRREAAVQAQDGHRRAEAAAVADDLERVRGAEESVAEFARDLFVRMSLRETADDAEVKRLARETEALLMEAAALEGAVEAADRRFKRWNAVFKDECARALVGVKPRYLPASNKIGVVDESAMQAITAWSGLKTSQWKEQFFERKWSVSDSSAQAWEGYQADASGGEGLQP